MQCPECNSPLMIAKREIVKDEVSMGDIEETTWVCINSAINPNTKKHVCSLYCGPDLNNPLKIAATVRNKVN